MTALPLLALLACQPTPNGAEVAASPIEAPPAAPAAPVSPPAAPPPVCAPAAAPVLSLAAFDALPEPRSGTYDVRAYVPPVPGCPPCPPPNQCKPCFLQVRLSDSPTRAFGDAPGPSDVSLDLDGSDGLPGLVPGAEYVVTVAYRSSGGALAAICAVPTTP